MSNTAALTGVRVRLLLRAPVKLRGIMDGQGSLFLVLPPNYPQEPNPNQLIRLTSEKVSIRFELRALARQIDKPAPPSIVRAVCSMSAGY
jgi:hypothetical protein